MTTINKSFKFLLLMFTLAFTFSTITAQVINDPLNGSTSAGTQVGGTFTSEGYKPGTGTNHILYTVPSQVSNGYIEFEMKGFTPGGISGENNDHAFLTMYDGRGIGNTPSWANYRDNYFRWNFHWRQNASYFKCVVNTAEPTSARLNSNFAVFVEDTDGDGDVDIDDRDWYDEPGGSGWSWNASTWYTVKIEWNNKTYKVYVDGTKVWENHKTGLYDYAPVDHKIWLGSGVSKYDSDNPDVVYRNFKLYSHGGSSNYLNVSPSSRSVSASSGNTTFDVSSNVSWSVSDDAGWLSVSPSSGSNDGTLTANYDENTSSSSRTGTITVTGGGFTRTVTVVQDGAASSNYLDVTPSSRNVSSDLGETTFNVSSDLSWSVSDDAGWLSVTPNSGTGDATLTASYDSNTSADSRTATITVSGGGITRTVSVIQSGQSVDPFLNVTPANHDVANTSGNVDFTIESNVTWSIRDDAEWLSKSVKDGSGNATLTATFEANTNASERTATITVTGGGFTRNVTVTQAAAAAFLTVGPSSQTVGDTSGSVSYSITSSVDWTISESADWCSVTPTSGSGSSSFVVNFDENTSSNLRSVEITVSGSGLTEIVTLVQQGRDFTPELSISPAAQTVGWDPGSFNFNIESNTDWAVTDDAEWLTKSIKDSSGNATLTVTFTENNDSTNRTATITVTGGDLTRTATITQEGAPIYTIDAVSSPEAASTVSGYGTFTYNTEVTLVCTPNSGWRFDGWKENGTMVSTDSSYTFSVVNSRSLVAELSELTSVFEIGAVPTDYKLYNNFPNPFNPTTVIRYALAEGSFVELSVYNLLGQKVVELVKENKPEGFYSIEFDAKNLPSGTYIYSLKAGNFTQTKKLVLLK